MKKEILSLWCILILVIPIRAQKASLNVKLVDSSFASYSDFIFQVEVRNDSFPSYFIQDTVLLRKLLPYHEGLLYVLLAKNVGGQYKPYEKVKRHSGDPIPGDSCRVYCCNCIFLSKGQTIKLRLPLLSNFNLENGEYELYVMLDPPMESCDDCDEIQFGEIYTQYYFRVR
jgi:hypothetical protein